jgi:hypothetical protein
MKAYNGDIIACHGLYTRLNYWMFIIHGEAAILKKYYNSSQTRQKYVIKLALINLGK